METSPSPCDVPFSSYAQISFKNGGQRIQKSGHLNFDNRFEVGEFEYKLR